VSAVAAWRGVFMVECLWWNHRIRERVRTGDDGSEVGPLFDILPVVERSKKTH
jgi:hypothetical protein